MKQKMLAKAVGIALVLAPLASQAAVENITYFGYAKWGNIYTDNDDHNNGKGERNDVIRASEGYGNYRLGNELNWWEAGLKADVWQHGDAYFDTTLYLGSGESWGDVSIIQMWSAGHGLIASQPNAKVWAGERFYRRHEVHMIDIKYWDTSSTGIGVEDWDLGFGNGHIAWMAPNSNGEDGRSLHNIDARISDIALSDTADLTFGLNYVFEQNSSHDEADITTSGAMLSALYRQAWNYGSNTLAFQYGTDALAGGLMSAEGGSNRKYSTGEVHDGYSWRLFNHGDLNVNEDFQVMYSIAYQDKNLDNNEGEKWFSVGARPQYSWTEYMATALEVGYETVEAQNGAGTNDMFKVTVAQMFQAGKGVWARPTLRVFATYSEKNDEWDRGGETYGAAMRSESGKQNVDEVTFGFNVETWW
ncbi:carbohydrate porin [Photobacterium sp. DNB23_23_1]|uniref:Carbohydrate porin n=1 Tax=Photobacterium pectinilyticum TaxID=2906793 RepID=A0ABT1N1A9_9GAMM|nr:carbohydrate porin [Photobacterium sp. ZSDE20]MCQ1058459.1 carbohydrate porin [Photobacterium sp. ZSDE20]MDD1823182.1 carbohydrate porin [Photobacterium sp. ZSDE20]